MTLYPQNLSTFPQSLSIIMPFFPASLDKNTDFSTFNITTINSTDYNMKKLVIYQRVERLGNQNSMV